MIFSAQWYCIIYPLGSVGKRGVTPRQGVYKSISSTCSQPCSTNFRSIVEKFLFIKNVLLHSNFLEGFCLQEILTTYWWEPPIDTQLVAWTNGWRKNKSKSFLGAFGIVRFPVFLSQGIAYKWDLLLNGLLINGGFGSSLENNNTSS